MRLFAAIAFDSAAKNALSGLYGAMRREEITGSFTPADNLHLTLKFLGETQPAHLTEIKAALCSAADNVDCFTLLPGRLGFFTARGEKTVWLGMEEAGLASLFAEVDAALCKIGYPPEQRAFLPHVTLARRAFCSPASLLRVAVPEHEIAVSSVTLFESRRDGGRLWYKPLYSAALRDF